jgi:hypothetical protein
MPSIALPIPTSPYPDYLVKFYTSKDDGYFDSVRSKLSNLKISANMPEFIEVSNAVYYPNEKLGNAVQYCGLYDSESKLIRESCTTYIKGEQEINVTLSPTIRNIEGEFSIDSRKFVYLGPLATAYGHLITEGIARLWYLPVALQEGRSLLVHGSRKHFDIKYIRDLYSFLNIHPDQLVTLEKPTILKDVLIPDPTFIIGGSACLHHLKLLQAIAEKALLNATISKTSQPLYLSRLRLRRRWVRNERLLEKVLRGKGFKIAYPETLSLQEQIKLFNQHDVIIGIQGSALHNLLFRLKPATNITLCRNPGMNYLVIDAMQRNDAHYVKCCRSAISLNKGREREKFVDVGIVVCGLREIGVL